MRRAACVFGVIICWFSIAFLTSTTAISAEATQIDSLKARTYTIGGTVIGLKNPGTVRIRDTSDNENESVSNDGTFKLPRAVKSGTAYDVTVGATPTGQSCAVQNGSGTVAKSNQSRR